MSTFDHIGHALFRLGMGEGGEVKAISNIGQLINDFLEHLHTVSRIAPEQLTDQDIMKSQQMADQLESHGIDTSGLYHGVMDAAGKPVDGPPVTTHAEGGEVEDTSPDYTSGLRKLKDYMESLPEQSYQELQREGYSPEQAEANVHRGDEPARAANAIAHHFYGPNEEHHLVFLPGANTLGLQELMGMPYNLAKLADKLMGPTPVSAAPKGMSGEAAEAWSKQGIADSPELDWSKRAAGRAETTGKKIENTLGFTPATTFGQHLAENADALLPIPGLEQEGLASHALGFLGAGHPSIYPEWVGGSAALESLAQKLKPRERASPEAIEEAMADPVEQRKQMVGREAQAEENPLEEDALDRLNRELVAGRGSAEGMQQGGQPQQQQQPQAPTEDSLLNDLLQRRILTRQSAPPVPTTTAQSPFMADGGEVDWGTIRERLHRLQHPTISGQPGLTPPPAETNEGPPAFQEQEDLVNSTKALGRMTMLDRIRSAQAKAREGLDDQYASQMTPEDTLSEQQKYDQMNADLRSRLSAEPPEAQAMMNAQSAEDRQMADELGDVPTKQRLEMWKRRLSEQDQPASTTGYASGGRAPAERNVDVTDPTLTDIRRGLALLRNPLIAGKPPGLVPTFQSAMQPGSSGRQQQPQTGQQDFIAPNMGSMRQTTGTTGTDDLLGIMKAKYGLPTEATPQDVVTRMMAAGVKEPPRGSITVEMDPGIGGGTTTVPAEVMKAEGGEVDDQLFGLNLKLAGGGEIGMIERIIQMMKEMSPRFSQEHAEDILDREGPQGLYDHYRAMKSVPAESQVPGHELRQALPNTLKWNPTGVKDLLDDIRQREAAPQEGYTSLENLIKGEDQKVAEEEARLSKQEEESRLGPNVRLFPGMENLTGRIADLKKHLGDPLKRPMENVEPWTTGPGLYEPGPGSYAESGHDYNPVQDASDRLEEEFYRKSQQPDIGAYRGWATQQAREMSRHLVTGPNSVEVPEENLLAHIEMNPHLRSAHIDDEEIHQQYPSWAIMGLSAATPEFTKFMAQNGMGHNPVRQIFHFDPDRANVVAQEANRILHEYDNPQVYGEHMPTWDKYNLHQEDDPGGAAEYNGKNVMDMISTLSDYTRANKLHPSGEFAEGGGVTRRGFLGRLAALAGVAGIAGKELMAPEKLENLAKTVEAPAAAAPAAFEPHPLAQGSISNAKHVIWGPYAGKGSSTASPLLDLEHASRHIEYLPGSEKAVNIMKDMHERMRTDPHGYFNAPWEEDPLTAHTYASKPVRDYTKLENELDRLAEAHGHEALPNPSGPLSFLGHARQNIGQWDDKMWSGLAGGGHPEAYRNLLDDLERLSVQEGRSVDSLLGEHLSNEGFAPGPNPVKDLLEKHMAPDTPGIASMLYRDMENYDNASVMGPITGKPYKGPGAP